MDYRANDMEDDAAENPHIARGRVEAAFLNELSWITDEKQRAAWLAEWMRIYEIGRKAANN